MWSKSLRTNQKKTVAFCINNVFIQEPEQILLTIVKNAEIFASSKVFFFVDVKTKRFLFGNCKTRST